jgi:cytochrome c biogenesis protein CcdA
VTAADLALALAAGLVAAVNPCGFALVPAYLSFLVLDGAVGRSRAVVRALALTAAMTAGFVAVFGVFGLAVAPAAGSVSRHLPWVTIVVGLTLVGLGGWLLAGRQIPALLPRLGRGPAVTRSAWSMVLFGAAYAMASLGCTVGPFLAVVVTSFRAGDVAAGIGLFVAYAAGMGLVVGTAAVAVALARTSVLTRPGRSSGRWWTGSTASARPAACAAKGSGGNGRPPTPAYNAPSSSATPSTSAHWASVRSYGLVTAIVATRSRVFGFVLVDEPLRRPRCPSITDTPQQTS